MNTFITQTGSSSMNRKPTFALKTLVALACLAPGLSLAGVNIKDLSVAAMPGNQVQIKIKADGPLPQPTSFTTDDPARLAVDFSGVASQMDKKPINIGLGLARNAQAADDGKRTRVLINLAAKSAHDVKVQGNEAIITLSGGNAPAASQGQAKYSGGGFGVNQVDFRRGKAGEGRILLSLASASVPVEMRREGNKVIVDISAKLPQQLMRRLDVTDFGTPVQAVLVEPNGDGTRISIESTGQYEQLAYQTDRDYVVEVKPLVRDEKARLRDKTYTGEHLSLNFQDIEVRSVLQLLADFTSLNLVVSDSVVGNITLRLQNVPWDQALDIILKAKNLDMRQKDRVIRVAPSDELAAAEKKELESQKEVRELAPLRTEWFRLSYAKADQFVLMIKGDEKLTGSSSSGKESQQGLLSERGSVTLDKRTNTIIVKDTDEVLDEVREMLRRLDIATQQVLIESRIVTANDDFAKDLGVRLGFSGSGVGGASNGQDHNANHFVVGGGVQGDQYYNLMQHTNSMKNPATWNPNGIGTTPDGQAYVGALVDSDKIKYLRENLMVNLPAAAATSGINFVLGRVASHLVRLELTAMQSEGKGEIISSPRVLTADQTKATIAHGQEVPYISCSGNQGCTTMFKEAALKLDVTPQITPDDSIMMDLTVSQDDVDWAKAISMPGAMGTSVPPINKRSVNTQTLVKNGETVVLGGVFQQETSKTTQKVPVLGDLPYLGRIFREDAQKSANRELLIFVTPKIIKEGLKEYAARAPKGK